MAKPNLTIVVNPTVDNAEAIKFLEEYFKLKVLQGIKTTDDIIAAELVVFTDGPHVNPQYYTEKLGKFTNIDKSRDDNDKKLYDLCKRYKKPFVGFGRGGELLNVLSGGRMIQFVNGHNQGNHTAQCTHFKSSITVNSAHTQMMYPFELPSEKYELIAWSKRYLSTTYLDGNNEEMDLVENFLEPEVLYFKSTKALAFQGNPAAVTASRDFKDFTISLIQNKLKS